jgi:hypothetical protein
MARPLKRGLSYFPFDTDLFNNRKILRLINKYGCDGAAVYFFVLCEIYSTEGYFVPFNEELCFDICFTFHISEARIKKILAYCVEIRLFDDNVLKKHQALSSTGIQERYLEVAKRLKKKCSTDLLDFKITSNILSVFPEETPVSPEETPVIRKETPS